MNIVIFGGSFDPIHCGHLSIIENICISINVDLLYVVPVGESADNKKYFFSDKERVILINTALGRLTPQECQQYHISNHEFLSNQQIVISDIELNKKSTSYTIDTVHHFKQQHPNATIHLIVGADQYENFEHWKNAQELLQLATLWVYPRKNHAIDNKSIPCNTLTAPLVQISSSQIKSKILSKEKIDIHEMPLNVIQVMKLFLSQKN